MNGVLEPLALVTSDDGPVWLAVDEVDGVLVDPVSGVPVELETLVLVVGLPDPV